MTSTIYISMSKSIDGGVTVLMSSENGPNISLEEDPDGGPEGDSDGMG